MFSFYFSFIYKDIAHLNFRHKNLSVLYFYNVDTIFLNAFSTEVCLNEILFRFYFFLLKNYAEREIHITRRV